MSDFTLPLLSGNDRTLSSFLTGYEGAVVVFWSGICSHCRRYDAYLNTWTKCNPGLGLVVVASREQETTQQMNAIVAERGLCFPILHDVDRTIAHIWSVQQTPTAFLLDAQRQLLYQGAIDNFKFPQDPDYVSYLGAAVQAFRTGQTLLRTETSSFGCPIESPYYTMPRQ